MNQREHTPEQDGNQKSNSFRQSIGGIVVSVGNLPLISNYLPGEVLRAIGSAIDGTWADTQFVELGTEQTDPSTWRSEE